MGEELKSLMTQSNELAIKEAMEKVKHETVIHENKILKEIIEEKSEELQRRRRAQGGASRMLQLEEKVRKLESENMAMECEMAELIELLHEGESEEEEESEAEAEAYEEE